MHEWIDDLRHLREAGKRAVIVTVAGVRGSAPREIGAKMLVSDSDTLGTIGGGQLEYQCTKIACELLQDAAANVRLLRRFPLALIVASVAVALLMFCLKNARTDLAGLTICCAASIQDKSC